MFSVAYETEDLSKLILQAYTSISYLSLLCSKKSCKHMQSQNNGTQLRSYVSYRDMSAHIVRKAYHDHHDIFC